MEKQVKVTRVHSGDLEEGYEEDDYEDEKLGYAR